MDDSNGDRTGEPDHSPHQYTPSQLLAEKEYTEVIRRIKAKVRSLRTVQIDHTNGVIRYFFNGKLEGVQRTRVTGKY